MVTSHRNILRGRATLARAMDFEDSEKLTSSDLACLYRTRKSGEPNEVGDENNGYLLWERSEHPAHTTSQKTVQKQEHISSLTHC